MATESKSANRQLGKQRWRETASSAIRETDIWKQDWWSGTNHKGLRLGSEGILKKNVFIFSANALVKAITSADADGDERSPQWMEGKCN